MNIARRPWGMRRATPVMRMLSRDDLLVPDHVREVAATTPKGYLDLPRDDQRSPDAGDMFITHVPCSRKDADTYLASMCHPHTRKERLLHRAATVPLPSLVQIYAVVVVATLAAAVYFSCAGTKYHAAATAALWAVCLVSAVLAAGIVYILVSLLADRHLDAHYDIYAVDAPTKLMREIDARGIDVTYIDRSLASLAWEVYLYDVEHYDELAGLIQDMHDNPAARGTKTRGVYDEIIDTFYRASELRQQAAKDVLDQRAAEAADRRRNADEHDRNSRKLADEARADMLKATVLERLRADELGAREVFGQGR